MRMPIAMYPIGLVLIVSSRTGHYSFAGALSGCYILGAAVGNPILARWTDRYGQGRVIVPASAVHVAATVTLALLLRFDTPLWTLVAPTIVVGFAYLSVGSLTRARWSLVLAGQPELPTAYSLESVLDEVIFVIGPLIATLIATQVDPVLVLYLAIALVAVGAGWLSRLHSTEPPAQVQGEPRHASAIRAPGMVLLTYASAGMGAVFASGEVAMVAFCGQRGERGLTGAVLALLALGSGVAGFVYGSRERGGALVTQFRRQSLVFAVLPLVLLAAVNVPALAACAFVVGLGIAPTLITGFGLVEQLVPSGALTEGLAWLLTGLNVGYGAGSALVGAVADAHGARSAFWVTIASALFVGLAAVVLHQRVSSRPTGSQPTAVAVKCDH
jgi:MFS family permease